MFRRFINKRVAVVLGGGALAVLGAVAAFAFFTANGSGSGSATVGTDAGVTVENISIPSTLYPGGTSPVSFDVKNLSSASSVSVANVVPDTGTYSNGVSTPSGCTNTDFTFTPNPVAVSTELAPNATVAESGTLSMVDATTNQDGCKSTAPTLYLKVDNTTIGGH